MYERSLIKNNNSHKENNKINDFIITNEFQSIQISSLNENLTINLKENIKLRSYEWDKNDVILCTTIINPDLVGIGFKSGLINIWNGYSENIVDQLIGGHFSGICSLASSKSGNYLVSGSDHGDCSIIIWDLNLKKIKIKYENAHKAAIVSLTFYNENNFISASYDKDIKVYKSFFQFFRIYL